MLVALIVVAIAVVVIDLLVKGNARPRPRGAAPAIDLGQDPLASVRQLAHTAGGGAYLGVTKHGEWRFSRSERAVLILGPPRSGKTSAVIVPSVIAHSGAVVCTSTKPDIAAATGRARRRSGRVWVFDPTGGVRPRGFEVLRWSPIRCARDWDGALLMARAMTAGARVGTGTQNEGHWAKRSQALLGPMLHAAAIEGLDMEHVVEWVMRHELDEPGIILEHPQASRLAFGTLVGLHHTEPRERASIFSAAADALEAYTSEAALEAAREPNFDPAAFISTADTVYICAPAEQQAAAAPLVCGLLAEIRRATYHAYRQRTLPARVMFALDEVANIAPLEELPAIASEGGGQGLVLLAALQDLSQARVRWGPAADGFLTLFGTKLILPGIADQRTLETVSVALGEYDRQMVSTTRTRPTLTATLGGARYHPQQGTTVSTQRTRLLSPGEIAGIPTGNGLHLDGIKWELLTLTPAYRAEPWKTLTTAPPAQR